MDQHGSTQGEILDGKDTESEGVRGGGGRANHKQATMCRKCLGNVGVRSVKWINQGNFNPESK